MFNHVDRIIINDEGYTAIVIAYDARLGRIEMRRFISREDYIRMALIPGVKVEDLREVITS